MDMGVRFTKVRVVPAPAYTFPNAPSYTYKGKRYVPVVCHALLRRSFYKEAKIKDLLRIAPRDKKQIEYDAKTAKLKAEIARDQKKFPKRKFRLKKARLKNRQLMRKIKFPLLYLSESAGDELTDAELKLFNAAYGTDAKPGPIPFTPCLLDPSRQPFIEVLKDIKQFLISHPHDIFLLTVEDYIQNLDIIANLFKQAGLDTLAYTHTIGKSWPTLGKLIKKNKRLVVFVQYWKKAEAWGNYPWKKYPWLHKKDDSLVETRFKFSSAKELLNHQQEVYMRPDQLLLMQHFITKKVGGNRKQAEKVNTYQALINRARSMIKQAGRIPNIINIDFVGIPSINDQRKALRHINGVGEFKGKPLRPLK